MEYESRVIKITVLPKGDDLFSERATNISVVDESGGEFVEVTQDFEDSNATIKINPDEWPELRTAIDRMISLCKETVSATD